MTTTDIRAWLREQDREVPSRGPLPKALVEEYNAAHPSDASVYDPPATAEGGETAPKVQEQTAAQKVKGWTRRRKPAAVKTDRPNARSRRRASTERVFSGVWTYGAQILGVRRELLPMARVMALQAPVAGVVIEDGIKGTAVDRLVQPLARMSEKSSEISALIGPPLLVALITQQPQLYPVLHGALYSSLVNWCKIAAPALKKKKAEMEKLEKEMSELGVEFGAEAGTDFIEAWIKMFFAAPPPEAVNDDGSAAQ